MPEKYEFSAEAGACLESSGWSSTRSVDVQELLARLRRFGYEPHERATTLLQSFYGLRVLGRGRLGISFCTAEWIATMLPYSDLLKLHESFDRLYPLGTVSTDLFVDPDGAIYSLDLDDRTWRQFEGIERVVDVALGISAIALTESLHQFVPLQA
jgi:hypothetical protein